VSDKGRNMLVTGTDQDWASAVEKYDELSPEDRGTLAQWLMNDTFDGAPEWVISWVRALASIAFLETGLRWSDRKDQAP
jgi:hypothetical protein